jgi:hypothetical protein
VVKAHEGKQTMTAAISEEQGFYKKFYFNHSVCIDEQWHHGSTAAELENAVGKEELEKFLSEGGEIEYPIYGVPAASGSIWLEDAKSPEDGVERVKELQDEANKLYKGYSDGIKALLQEKRDGLWGPGSMKWNHSKIAIQRLVDDLSLTIAVDLRGVELSEEQVYQINEFASEILFHELQNGMVKDDDQLAISKLATLAVRSKNDDVSADIVKFVADPYVKNALENGKITAEDVVPFTVYLKAFDQHAVTDFMNKEFRDEHENVLLKDFIGLKKEKLSGMPLIEAAQKECDRLARKYGIERYPAGYWGDVSR